MIKREEKTMQKMTFEQWKQRPVYVAQCKTAGLARDLGLFCFHFRALPAYRDAQAQRARNAVADVVREMRKRGEAIKLIERPALATMHHDLASELAL
jgi:hypothetical protein